MYKKTIVPASIFEAEIIRIPSISSKAQSLKLNDFMSADEGGFACMISDRYQTSSCLVLVQTESDVHSSVRDCINDSDFGSRYKTYFNMKYD